MNSEHDSYYEIDPCADPDDEIYPCVDCGKLRSFNQGASVFNVCDACWDKHHANQATDRD